jgi:bacterioferritin B
MELWGMSLKSRKERTSMRISVELLDGLNAQVGHEFGASLQYLGIAGYFKSENLAMLAGLFFEQAEEEKEHALKFVHYILDTGSRLSIPVIPEAKFDFNSAEEAVAAALYWEVDVTGQIHQLMDLAHSQHDYLSQSFLKWFVDEQLEEVTKMEQLLSVVRRAGERNLLMVEAYLVHLDSGE